MMDHGRAIQAVVIFELGSDGRKNTFPVNFHSTWVVWVKEAYECVNEEWDTRVGNCGIPVIYQSDIYGATLRANGLSGSDRK